MHMLGWDVLEVVVFVARRSSTPVARHGVLG